MMVWWVTRSLGSIKRDDDMEDIESNDVSELDDDIEGNNVRNDYIVNDIWIRSNTRNDDNISSLDGGKPTIGWLRIHSFIALKHCTIFWNMWEGELT